MKKLLVICAVMASTFSSFGQTDGISMIVEIYGQSYFDEMSISNPGQITFLEKYAMNGFTVVESNSKYDDFQELTEIPLRSKTEQSISVEEFLQSYDSGMINPLRYGFFPSNEIQIFKLHGTNRVLLIDRQSSILDQ